MTRHAILALFIVALGSHHALADDPPAPWTDEEVEALTPEDGKIFGWTEKANIFGFCAHVCESRNDDYPLECYFAEVPTDAADSPASLEPVNEVTGTWTDEEFFKALGSTDPLEVNGATYHVTSAIEEQEAGEDLCSWSLEVTPAKGEKPFIAGLGEGDCFEEAEPVMLLSPDKKSLAVVVSYHGDHGCGEIEGSLWTLPITAPLTAPGADESACYRRFDAAGGHARLKTTPAVISSHEDAQQRAFKSVAKALGADCGMDALPFLTNAAQQHISCHFQTLRVGPSNGRAYGQQIVCTLSLDEAHGAFTVIMQGAEGRSDVTYLAPIPTPAPAQAP